MILQTFSRIFTIGRGFSHRDTHAQRNVSARALINAAGPWVNDVSRRVLQREDPLKVRRAKGSHIVVRRLFDHDRAYIFQNADRRIIFAIPYYRDFTLIGTTEQDFVGDPADAKINEDEINYLCTAASEYFRVPVPREAIVWTYSGVRALHDDGTSSVRKVSRAYHLELEDAGRQAPLLTIHGGKITTYRRLAEDALARLTPYIGTYAPWTAAAALPGGDVPPGGIEAIMESLIRDYPFLARLHLERLVDNRDPHAEQEACSLRTCASAVIARWLGIRPPLHPGCRRFSSVEYYRYAPSSRLVNQAPRHPRCTSYLAITALERAVRHHTRWQ